MKNILSDVAAEKGVLAGIYQYGAEIYHDISVLINVDSFTIESNARLYKCFVHILEQDDSRSIDLPSIISAAQELNLSHLIERRDEAKHIDNIIHFNIQQNNVKILATKIRKLQIARSLYDKLEESQKEILAINGNESIIHILNLAENILFDFTTTLEIDDNELTPIGKNSKEYIDYLKSNPVDQIGISTGFCRYDAAIGGGLRRGTINVIGGRAKMGKSMFAHNVGIAVAQQNIKVLTMDTEMTKEDHIHRCMSHLITQKEKNNVTITNIETGKFSQESHKEELVYQTQQEFEKLPYYFKSIGGIPLEDQLSIMRRWIIKEVGLNINKEANHCLIIYDYLKLMTADSLSSSLQEYQALGFLMTTLHNFALKYKIPILALCQLNRDGITKETTDIVSGSDRIIWLCSNFSILKEKSDAEIAEDHDQYGRHKLIPLISRHGQGLSSTDYINYNMLKAYATFQEYPTKYELEQKNQFDKNNNKDITF